MEVTELIQSSNTELPSINSEVLSYEESVKYYAGCALNGFTSECRLGIGITDTQMGHLARQAAKLGKMTADAVAQLMR